MCSAHPPVGPFTLALRGKLAGLAVRHMRGFAPRFALLLKHRVSTMVRGWRARLGSNQQPLPSEGSTLSIELRTRSVGFYQRTPCRLPAQGGVPGAGPIIPRFCAGVREPLVSGRALTAVSAPRTP